MSVTGNTQLSATKQTVIAAMVQRELKFTAKLLPTITDVSMFAVAGSNQVQFPKLASFTVENRASGVAGALQTAAATVDTLILDYRAYISWVVDSVDAYQSNINVQAEYIKRAATAHARSIDSAIITKLDTDSGYVQPAGITKAKILNARIFLMKNQADLNSATILVNPDDESALLSIAEFVEADKYGSSNIPNGVLGRIFGMNVIAHTEPVAKSFIYTKEAIAGGFQMGAKYAEQKDVRYGTDAMLCAIDQLYGFKSLQLGNGNTFAGVALAGTASPFIAEISGI